MPVEKAHGASAEPATVVSVNLVGVYDSAPHLVDIEFSSLGSWWDARVNRSLATGHTRFFQGGYLIVFFDPYYQIDSPYTKGDGWIEVWIWMGGFNAPPEAYVYNSSNFSVPGGEGTFYEVDLFIEGYLISGPSY